MGEWFVHQVLAAAHTERPIPAIAIDAQHNMVKAVTRKLGLKADGKTLERRQPIGQVADQHRRIKERSGRIFVV